MNTFDIIAALLVIIPGVIMGIRKGFIYQVLTLAALILGVWMSYNFSEPVGKWMQGFMTLDEKILQIIAFIAIFLGVYLVLFLIGALIEKILKDLVGGWLNKTLGILLGIAKLAILVSLAVFLFDSLNNTFHFVKQQAIDSSVFYPYLKHTAEFIFPYIKTFVTKGQIQL